MGPDIIVSAGGIIHATAAELGHETPARAVARLHGIGDTLTAVLDAARTTGSTPAAAARHLADTLSRPTHPGPRR